ncbi:hypothetical protein F3Y22_tig00116971pilonHSYRG00787 [Hibiscus syriacus]|uniref:Uncharacterized protein n=1 Tax=Hibiscus syriacus TaxID=106335 RepID=A0A6A2WSV0_HIBSY|nr:hypothetical protein F3Y22_tig00116971pilonHSYRG00787 [Hibiscus syriacus]
MINDDGILMYPSDDACYIIFGSLSPVGKCFNDCINDALDAKESCFSLKDADSPSRKTTGCSGGWTSSADEADAIAMDNEDRSGKSFQEQRKAHYDEYFKINELRRKCSFLEEEDDGVEGDSSSSKTLAKHT